MYCYFIFCYRIIIIILLSKNIYVINANGCCPLLVSLDPHHSLKYNNIEFNLLTSKSYLVFIISSPICILTHTKYAMCVHVVKEYISFYSRVMAFRELTSYVSVNLIMLCILYGRLICLSTCQHNYLFLTYNIIHLYLHVCDNITLYKSWLFKLKSEYVSTKYQYSYTKSNFEPSSTKLRLNNLITCFIHLRLSVKDTHFRKLFLFKFILTFGIKYRHYTNGIHIKLSHIHDHKINIMQVFLYHMILCLFNFIYLYTLLL